MRIPQLSRSNSLFNLLSLQSSRRFVAVLLATQMLVVPVPASGAVISDAIQRSGRAMKVTVARLGYWLGQRSSEIVTDRGVRPPSPENKNDRLNRLARLQINPTGAVQLHSHELMLFTAVPFDSDGSAIHGLQAEWESSDKQIVFVKKSGEVIAGKPGVATLTARAGSLTANVQVIVLKGDREPFGKTKADSTRSNLGVTQIPSGSARNLTNRPGSSGQRRHHQMTSTASGASLFRFLRDPNDDPLPDNETISLYKPVNTVGSPPGKKEVALGHPRRLLTAPRQTATRISPLRYRLPVCLAEGSTPLFRWSTTVLSGTNRRRHPPVIPG